MNRRILTVLLFLTVAAVLPAQDGVPRPIGSYWVIAPSGLNLREGPDVSSPKIGKIPGASQVQIIESAAQCDLTVDEVPGGMARVSFQGQEGYVFDGYLSFFPPPFMVDDTETYAEVIRDRGGECLYETHRYDWGGYIRTEEAVTLPNAYWSEAFILASQLYDIPDVFEFPLYGTEALYEIPNPNAPDYAWTDQLTVYRTDEGWLEEIRYDYRGEASGRSVSIKYNEDGQGMRIALILTAD